MSARSEFEAFLSAEAVDPPARISGELAREIHARLNPSAWRIFPKLALIHLMMGSISLALCPQFGVSSSSGGGVMSYLMELGNTVCMLVCGAIFIAGSALVASLLLQPEEVRVIRRTEPLQFAILGLLSMGAFACAGVNLLTGLALIWLCGLILGGLAAFEMGWVLRRSQYRKPV